MERNLFFADTSYQLLTVINVVSNLDSNENINDLIIYHQFRNAEELSKRVKETKLFDKVYDIKITEKFNKKLFEIFQLCLCSTYLKNICGFEKKKYDKFCCATIDNNSTIASIFASNVKNITLYDDGLGSYIGNVIDDHMSSKRALLLKMFHFRRYPFTVKEMMLYRPDFCMSKIDAQHSKINFCNNIVERVFAYCENDLYKEKAVFLDQPLIGDETIFLNKFAKIQNIIKDASKNNYIVRAHPRMNKPNLLGKIDKVNNMWELECINQISNSNILITVFSTAAIQPYFICDECPKVIFLYHLFEDAVQEKIIQEMDDLNNRLLSQGFRIYLPHDFREFEEDLYCLYEEE